MYVECEAMMWGEGFPVVVSQDTADVLCTGATDPTNRKDYHGMNMMREENKVRN